MSNLSIDIGDFIYRYYIHPIVNTGEGNNPVNTVTYAIILDIRNTLHMTFIGG